MTTILPLYWNLSSASKKERIDASVKLIGALEDFQTQFAPKSPSEVSDDGDDVLSQDEDWKGDQLDASNAQDVSYAIRRLIRGLASPRESSRLGFAVALTELLTRIDTVTCSQILAMIQNASQTSGSMTGQEERDMLFARLFGLMSVIQSGLLVRLKPLAMSSTVPCSQECFETVLTDLINLGERKSWLRESCWWTIWMAVEAVHSSKVPWRMAAVDTLLDRVFVQEKRWTSEKVAIALKLPSLFSSKDWQKFFAPTFKGGEILSNTNLGNLGRILKESTTDDADESQTNTNTGSWKPQLHVVWDIIFDALLLPSAKPHTCTFQEFYRIVVDETLFSSSSSPERKYWGFQIFQKALQRLSPADLPFLFTKNFMRSWINHLSNTDRYLHKVARRVASDIQAVVTKDPAAGFTLVLQLTGTNGTRQFDRMTKTKTVDSILTSMDLNGIKTYIGYLLKQVDEGDELNTPSAVNTRRTWIVDQLTSLLRHGSIPKDDEWILTVLNWLTVHGIFEVVKKSSKSPYHALHCVPEPAFSDELREYCRTRLLSCLGELTRQASLVKDGEESKITKATSAASDGQFWVIKVLNTITELEQDEKHVRPSAEVEEETEQLRKKVIKTTHRLDQITGTDSDAAKGAKLLLAAVTLKNYCGDEEAGTLETCIESVEKAFPEKKLKSSKKSATDVDNDSNPVDVLVDVIIGFLEKSTTFTREVAKQVFSMLTGLVRDSTIGFILLQLERRDPVVEVDGDYDDNEDTSGGEENSEPGHSIDVSESEGDRLSKQSHEGSEAEENLDDDDADAQAAELRTKLEKAFGVVEPMDGDPASESSDEELMDDDQMMAIDDQIAAVFRTQANEKKDGGAQREATHFKNRVLDLVDIFIKKRPFSNLVVKLILPLIEVIVGTGSDERQLSDKATGILRSRLAKSKELPTNTVDSEVIKVLEAVHVRARKAHSPDIVTTLNQCSLYLSRLLLASGEGDLLRIYYQSLVDFTTRKASALQPNFFLDFIRRFPLPAWALRSKIVELTTKSVNGYRQVQTFHMLEAILIQFPNMGPREQELNDFMPTLRQALHSALLTACASEEPLLTASQMKEIFKAGLQAVRVTKRVLTPSETSRIWDPRGWDDLLTKLASSDRFKASTSLQVHCKQISRTSQEGGEVKSKSVPPKRKVEDEGEASPKKAKRKKMKKSHRNKED